MMSTESLMMRAIVVGVVCLFASAVSVVGQLPSTGGTRPIELADLWSIRTFTRVQISPDGKQVFFSMTSPTGGADELKLLDVTNGHMEDVDFDHKYHGDQSRFGHDVVWDKTGGGLLFVDTQENTMSLWRWDLATRKSMQLFAHDQATSLFVRFEQSPDGRQIAFASAGNAAKTIAAERKQAMETGELVLDADHTAPESQQQNEVWVWERSTGRTRRVHAGGSAIFDLEWSPDGTKLALQFNRSRFDNNKRAVVPSLLHGGVAEVNGIVVVDLTTGRSQALRDTLLQADAIVGWSPDGQTLGVNKYTMAEVFTSDAGVVGVVGGNTFERWTWHAKQQAFRPDTSPLLRWPPERNAEFARLNVADATHWHSNGTIYHPQLLANRTEGIGHANPGGESHPLTTPRWNLTKVSFAARANVAACVRETANEPQELALFDLRSGEVKTLTSLNAPVLNLEHPRVEPYRVVNRFGYTTDNWLIKPPNYHDGKRYPLVILLYNFNNQFAAQPWMKNYAPFEYAKLGLVVLLANYPNYDGAPGEGRQTVPERWRFGLAVNPLASFEAAVDRLVADGLVDPTKVAISGFSYGSFLTQYAITHSSKFSLAFLNDGHGAWNPGIYYFSLIRDMPWLYMTYDVMFGGPPFGRGARIMQDFLPAYRLGQLPVPILLEEHAGDQSVAAMADIYFTARQDGTPIEAVLYTDQHVMADRQRQLSSISRSTDWFRYWLLGTENPNPLDKDEYVRWAELRKRLAALKKTAANRTGLRH